MRTCNKCCREACLAQSSSQRLRPGLVIAEHHSLVEADSAQQLQQSLLPHVWARGACKDAESAIGPTRGASSLLLERREIVSQSSDPHCCWPAGVISCTLC